MPMKNSLIYLLIASGLSLSVSAHAEDTDCQITISQGEVNYAQLRREDAISTQQSWHKMPEREVTISASCPEKMRMGVQVQGIAGEKGRFLFGQKGGVAFKVSSIFVDGKTYNVGKTTDQINLTPESGSVATMYIQNNDAIVAVENNSVPAGKQMSFTVTMFPVLNDSAFSGIKDETQLETDISWLLLTKTE